MPHPVIHIDDPADPRIAAYCDIRERDLVGRQGGFIAEGEVVLRAAIGSGRHAFDSLLISAQRISVLDELLAKIDPLTPVYAASQPVLDAIVGFNLHRGILAAGRQAPQASLDELLAFLPAQALVLVLVGIANHDNMGGLFRNAAAFGADAVLIDPGSCDPYYRKAIRVSVGACLTVPFIRTGAVDEALDALAVAGFRLLALSPSGATPLKQVAPGPRTALLLGAEGPGLPPELMTGTATVRIEMAGELDSLNVATAAAIALHQLSAA